MPTINILAKQMYQAFEKKQRTDESTYYSLRDGSPEWMEDVCLHAHGDMGPDDLRYEMIYDVVSKLDDLEEDDDPQEALDNVEAPIYTHELTGWLASRNDRYSYCDEAMEEYESDFSGLIPLLQMGYKKEFDEVWGLVLVKLEELATDEDENAEDVEDV